jgi:hypothetical protein
MYKFSVVDIDIPEYETGTVDYLHCFNDPESAFEMIEELTKDNEDAWYTVIIEKVI